MVIKVKFGSRGKEFLLDWPNSISSFPKIVTYEGGMWEWTTYDKSIDKDVDWFIILSPLDPYYVTGRFGYLDKVDFDEILQKHQTQRCLCGAKHTSFPQIHMFFCPKRRD
jgi:hypothetical protein